MAVRKLFVVNLGANLSQRALRRATALLAVCFIALITTSCASSAEAAGSGTLILPDSLPNGSISAAYHAALPVAGGPAPYQYWVGSGALPPGVDLNPWTGALTGTPSISGTFKFEIVVTNYPENGRGSQKFAVEISNSSQTKNVTINVSPNTASLSSGATQQFTANVSGTSNTAVTWAVSSGKITSSGLYTAPQEQARSSVVVTATTRTTPAVIAKAVVTVNSDQTQPLQITTSDLLEAELGSSYSNTLTASGGTPPYSWSVTSGNLPHGISVNANGAMAGTPSATGTFTFSATVTDSKQLASSASMSMTVSQAGGFDGPAQLPIVTIATAMSGTPAPGAVIHVNAGGDLQAALQQVTCGETIELQAGATFNGQYVVQPKNCDENNWIIIRTSSPDSVLPAEGSRLTPCYAGVASLPGRPAYACTSPQNVLAKVQMNSGGDGPFQISAGANYYRFVGLEITRALGTPSGRLMNLLGPADHIFVDRSWLHGQTNDETYAGIAASGGTNIALFDSYVSDLHCIAISGDCTDAHAFSGGVGDTQDGPYLVQNNFLEASGEAVMFGGGPATKTPTDITIQGNHFWKPWQWMPGSPNFVGGPKGHPFIVKNHIELKNASRVLIQANLLENNWGGFSQSGFSILLTPKNQYSEATGKNVCPLCQVTDVTIRYNHVSHVGGGVQIASSLSDGGGAALAGARYSLHDLVMDDLNHKYVGGGVAFELDNSWQQNPINTVTINHVTAFPDTTSHMIIMGNPIKYPQMYGLVFTNNLIVAGQYPVWNAIGSINGTSCSAKDVPLTSIATCFTTYQFENNAVIASPSNYPPSAWPSRNFFPETVESVEFTNFNDGNGGNYELQAGSQFKGKGTDGKDLGADIVGLEQQLAGVE